MSFSNLLIYFFVGGTVTTVIVALEQGGQRVLSGLAALIPIFTLVAYFFIGQTKGGVAVSQHAKFVLVGTLLTWVPYMLAVIILAPRMGSQKAILLGLLTFFVLALAYIAVTIHWKLFQ